MRNIRKILIHKKRAVGIMVICLAIMAFMVLLYLHSYNPNSVIPHKGLESIIREQIGKPTGKITPEDCIGIAELSIGQTPFMLGPSDLEGLQYFVDLEILSCSTWSVSDISALAELSKIRELYLDNNKIRDLTPLSGLTNLEKLKLYNNKIDDLRPLN